MNEFYVLVNKSHTTAISRYVYVVKSVKLFKVEIAILFPSFVSMQCIVLL